MSAEDTKEEIDVSTLSEDDRKFYEKFGRLPPKGKAPTAAARMNQGKRKYFDSGEYFSKNKGAGGETGAPPTSSAAPSAGGVPSGPVKHGNPLLNKAAANKPNVRIQVKTAGDSGDVDGQQDNAEDDH